MSARENTYRYYQDWFVAGSSGKKDREILSQFHQTNREYFEIHLKIKCNNTWPSLTAAGVSLCGKARGAEEGRRRRKEEEEGRKRSVL